MSQGHFKVWAFLVRQVLSAINKLIRVQRNQFIFIILSCPLLLTCTRQMQLLQWWVKLFSHKKEFFLTMHGTSSSLLKRNGSSIVLALGDSCKGRGNLELNYKKTTSKRIKSRILLLYLFQYSNIATWRFKLLISWYTVEPH